MAEADAEERDAAERLARQLDRSVEHRGVARPVGQDEAVRAGRLDVASTSAVCGSTTTRQPRSRSERRMLLLTP